MSSSSFPSISSSPRGHIANKETSFIFFAIVFLEMCLRAPANITRRHFSWDNYTSFLLKGYLLHTWPYFLRSECYSCRTEKYNRNKNDRRQKDCHITMRRIRQFPTPCIMLGGATRRGDRLCVPFPSRRKSFFSCSFSATLSTRLILFQSKSASTRIILSTDQIIETL